MSSAARPRVPGEAGIWVVVLGDVAVFLVLFGMFLHYRAQEPAVFAAGEHHLTRGLGFAETLLLLTSSLAAAAGVREHRDGDGVRARRGLAVAIALGVAFVCCKAVEWTLKAHAGHVPDADDFFALYFVLTGLHLVHVLCGLGVLAVVRRVAGHAPPRSHDRALVASGVVFWHMVDLLWLFLFGLLYFVR